MAKFVRTFTFTIGKHVRFDLEHNVSRHLQKIEIRQEGMVNNDQD